MNTLSSSTCHQRRNLCLSLLGVGFLGGCSPLRLVNSLNRDADIEVIPAIAYGPHPRHRLDIYLPPHRVPSAPVAVFFYGGSWQNGNRADYAFAGITLARRGIVTVIADYRLYPEIRFPVFVQDAASSGDWVSKHIGAYGGDANRLYLIGHSAGAYMALLAGCAPDFWPGGRRVKLAGLIGLSGPYDFDPSLYPSIRSVFAGVPASEVNVLARVDAGDPPALLMHGALDSLVYVRNTKALAQRFRERGADVVMRIMPDLGHAGLLLQTLSPLRNDDKLLNIVTDYIWRS